MQTMIRYQTGEKIQLVFACSWCPEKFCKPLGKKKQYTHGVCEIHLAELLEGMRKKKGQYDN